MTLHPLIPHTSSHIPSSFTTFSLLIPSSLTPHPLFLIPSSHLPSTTYPPPSSIHLFHPHPFIPLSFHPSPLILMLSFTIYVLFYPKYTSNHCKSVKILLVEISFITRFGDKTTPRTYPISAQKYLSSSNSFISPLTQSCLTGFFFQCVGVTTQSALLLLLF